jgi:starvation-inducible DNA-binding protein
VNTGQNVTQIKDHETTMAAVKMPQQASSKEWDAIAALNQCLANTIELKSRIKQAHWAAKGENFYAFHRLSEDFTAKLDKQADRLSARIVAIGGVPAWTPAMIVRTSSLPEYPPNMVKVPEFLEVLVASYAVATEPLPALISKATKHDDYVTATVFTGFSKLLDEQKSLLASLGGITWLAKPKKQQTS